MANPATKATAATITNRIELEPVDGKHADANFITSAYFVHVGI
jgi:hypothetical protein